jgi:hypothetical protein
VKAWTATGVLVALIVLLALGLFPALLVASSTLATPLAPRRSHRSGRPGDDAPIAMTLTQHAANRKA